MRAITDTAYNWTFGFFYARKTSSPQPEHKILHVSPGLYLTEIIDGESYHQYLSEKKFIDDGYTEVRLYNFDFRKFELTPLLGIIDQSFTFIQAEFTISQIQMLLQSNISLEKYRYRSVESHEDNGFLSHSDYTQLYDFCAKNNLQKSLHGVSVAFREESDIHFYPDDFIAVCHPISLYDVTVSQAQFDSLLSNHTDKPLDLSGIILANLDISQLINQHERIIFNKEGLSHLSKKICLSETSIRDSIIDFETLCTLVLRPTCIPWFYENDLTFKIRYENVESSLIEVNVDEFLRSLATKKPEPVSARSIRPKSDFDFDAEIKRNPPQSARIRLFQPETNSALAIKLKNELIKIDEKHAELNIDTLPNGEKLLWLFYCIGQRPDSFFALTVNEKLKALFTGLRQYGA